MGTRADFYVGRGEDAEWLGSTAFDGYPEGFDADLWEVQDETVWRTRIAKLLAGRKDGTTPDMGWPWPWDTSHTTDYAYAFDCGSVYGSCFGSAWFLPSEGQSEPEAVEFPDMSDRKNVSIGGPRDGLIVVSARPPEEAS